VGTEYLESGVEERILSELLYMREALREFMHTLAVKCPRCHKPMSPELKALRDDWGRIVYRLVLVCYTCKYELVSNTFFSEKEA
jgi:hypothetical protein